MQTHYCRAQLQAQLMDPFLANSSLSPSIILIPEGPQKNRWSGGLKRGCESIIKVEQWLPRALSSGSLACTWFMLTFLAGSKLRLRFQPGSLPPACNPNLYTHCLQTKGCPKSPSPDTFREGESAHLGCPCGCTAHSTQIWSATAWLLKHFCHGFIISPVRWHVPRGWGPCSLPPAQCCGALGLLQFLWASEQIPRGLLAPPRIPGQQASRASSPLPQIHLPGLSLHSKHQPVPEASSLQFYRLNSMTEAPRPGRYNRPLCLHHSGLELRS